MILLEKKNMNRWLDTFQGISCEKISSFATLQHCAYFASKVKPIFFQEHI